MRAIDVETARKLFDLDRFGDIGEIAAVDDGYLVVRIHDGPLEVDGDFDQAMVAEHVDEIAEHTLVIIDGDLRASGTIDIAQDNTYTHLVVTGNLVARVLYLSAPVGVAGDVTVAELHGLEDWLIVLGTLRAEARIDD